MREKVVVAWSGGKDSALALHEIVESERYEVRKLLTTITLNCNRISIHGVRRVLLEQQANALGFPFGEIFVSNGSSNEEYESALLKALKRQRDESISSVVFGDIFLEDVRKYREQILAKVNMKGIFPLWKRNTYVLARRFINLGFKAVITSIDTKALAEYFVGREYDEQFLSDLPQKVDPSGENGEFHSLVYDGPIFNERLSFTKGKRILRGKRFYYCDLIPVRERK